MTVREAAKNWGKSESQVRRDCAEGRVPGAKKDGAGHWHIPDGLPAPYIAKGRAPFAAVDCYRHILNAVSKGELILPATLKLRPGVFDSYLEELRARAMIRPVKGEPQRGAQGYFLTLDGVDWSRKTEPQKRNYLLEILDVVSKFV